MGIIERTGGWVHKQCSAIRIEDGAMCANEATRENLCAAHAYLKRRPGEGVEEAWKRHQEHAANLVGGLVESPACAQEL